MTLSTATQSFQNSRFQQLAYPQPREQSPSNAATAIGSPIVELSRITDNVISASKTVQANKKAKAGDKKTAQADAAQAEHDRDTASKLALVAGGDFVEAFVRPLIAAYQKSFSASTPKERTAAQNDLKAARANLDFGLKQAEHKRDSTEVAKNLADVEKTRADLLARQEQLSKSTPPAPSTLTAEQRAASSGPAPTVGTPQAPAAAPNLAAASTATSAGSAVSASPAPSVNTTPSITGPAVNNRPVVTQAEVGHAAGLLRDIANFRLRNADEKREERFWRETAAVLRGLESRFDDASTSVGKESFADGALPDRELKDIRASLKGLSTRQLMEDAIATLAALQKKLTDGRVSYNLSQNLPGIIRSNVTDDELGNPLSKFIPKVGY